MKSNGHTAAGDDFLNTPDLGNRHSSLEGGQERNWADQNEHETALGQYPQVQVLCWECVMNTASKNVQTKLRSLDMELHQRVCFAESILAQPMVFVPPPYSSSHPSGYLHPMFTESRDPGAPGLLHHGTGSMLPEALHLSIELGIKGLIEAFGGPGTVKDHNLHKLLARLEHVSGEGEKAVSYLSKSFDFAVRFYGLLHGPGDNSRFETIQEYFRSTGRAKHYEAYRYKQPSAGSDFEMQINSVWRRIDLRLHLEVVRTLMYSAYHFDCSLNPDVAFDSTPPIVQGRIVGPFLRALGAAALPEDGEVSPPDDGYFTVEHRIWLQDAVRTSYLGKAAKDSPQARAARILNEESRGDIALRYRLDLWKRTEPEPEELDARLANGYALLSDYETSAFVYSKNETPLGCVRRRSDGLWNTHAYRMGHEERILSSKKHAVAFIMERTTQPAHVFANGQNLGEMCLMRYLGTDFRHVEGYPCGWDGSKYHFEFLEPHQFAIGDNLGFGFTDKGEDEPEGIGGRVVDVDQYVVRIGDLWGLEWDGLSLNKTHELRFPSTEKEESASP